MMGLWAEQPSTSGETIIPPSEFPPEQERLRRRIAFITAYDGRGFHGWQRQGEDQTVQGCLEEALHRLTGATIPIVGSGRTDAGVSAHGQVFHLDLPPSQSRRWTPESLRKGANHFLPAEIRILAGADVTEDFHARHDVQKKIYRYRFRIILPKVTPSPLENPFTGVFPAPMSPDLLKRAADCFLGNHDFTHFTVRKSLPPKTLRTIDHFFWERDGLDTQIWIVGKGFLHMMIRFMVGAMMDVAGGQRSLAEIGHLLLPGSPPPPKALKPAPPEGLSLIRVLYGDKDPFLQAK